MRTASQSVLAPIYIVLFHVFFRHFIYENLCTFFQGIKLSGLSDLLKIRAIEAKIPFPSRHEWDSYFRDAKHMNEMKPGERPDTIYLQVC